MQQDAVKYSVIIPVYNSSKSLPMLVEKLNRVFNEHIREKFEILMIDDGSPNPHTWKILSQIAEQYDTVECIQLTRNFGRAGALLCGFEQGRGEYFITMDDDLQHCPEDIPILLAEKDHDIVFANFKERKHSFLVRMTSEIKGWLDRIIIGRPKGVKVSSFSLVKGQIIKSMLCIRTPYPFIPAMMFYVSKDIATVFVKHEERSHGKSGFTFMKRLKQFSRLLINNSSLLLQAVAVIGILMALFSGFYSIYLVVRRFYQHAYVPGWTSLMVVLLITSGLVLFSLGLIGEYLIRIINGIEGRPSFIIRNKAGGGQNVKF